jgi:hypothetical protein
MSRLISEIEIARWIDIDFTRTRCKPNPGVTKKLTKPEKYLNCLAGIVIIRPQSTLERVQGVRVILPSEPRRRNRCITVR